MDDAEAAMIEEQAKMIEAHPAAVEAITGTAEAEQAVEFAVIAPDCEEPCRLRFRGHLLAEGEAGGRVWSVYRREFGGKAPYLLAWHEADCDPVGVTPLATLDGVALEMRSTGEADGFDRSAAIDAMFALVAEAAQAEGHLWCRDLDRVDFDPAG